MLAQIKRYAPAGISVFAAAVFLDSLRYKFTDHPNTQEIFGRLDGWVKPLLLGMALLSWHWQRYADSALLDFVLGVMAFAYSGLLGVYGVALFTRRGSSASVVAAFVAGFLTVLAFQPFAIDLLGLPLALKGVAFPWQLVLGTLVAAVVCALGKGKVAIAEQPR